MKAQFCPRCGRAHPHDAKFCPSCGSPRWVEGMDPLHDMVVAGRYRLLDKIDESSVGPLYRAEDLQLGRSVAVRLLDPELALNGTALEQVQAEMRAIGAHASEHLVPLLDFGSTSEGRLFVAMEFPEGDSLRAALDREVRLTVPRVIDILQQIAETLSKPHAIGWIHGDLRPRNVLLVPIGTPESMGARDARGGGKDFIRLLDFGLAQLLLSGTRSGAALPRLTYGDPHYMAPEQVLGESVDGRADLHAMGVLGYEMLVGELPFAGAHHHSGETLERLLGALRPSVRARRPECPDWLDALLQRAMARRPEDRFSGVEQLLGYLGRGGEATPVELVAERARSDKVTTGGGTPERRETVQGTGALVGDPVPTKPEVGQVIGGASVPVLAESEAAMDLMVSQALPRSEAAAAGAVAFSMGTGPAMNGPVGRAGTESESQALQAKGESHRTEVASLAGAKSAPSGGAAPAAAEKTAAAPSATASEGQRDLSKVAALSEGRPRGEPTDQFWFNSALETAALGEEEYADEGRRRDLGALVGIIVGGVCLLLILVIALWPKSSDTPGPGSSAAPTGHR